MRSSVIESNPVARPEERRLAPEYVQQYHTSPLPPGPVYKTAKPAVQKVKSSLMLAPAEGWLPLVLLAVAAYAVVFCIILAKWVGHTSILFWSTSVGLVIGVVIAKIPRLPQSILHVAACLGGYWLSIWLASALAFHISWVVLLASLRAALESGLGGNVSAGASDIVFLFYLSFVCYYLGYFGAWLTYRAHLPWIVALVYCAIVLINLNYVSQDASLVVFVLVAALVLLIARVQLSKRLARWVRNGLQTNTPALRKASSYFMVWASLFSLLALLTAWVLPVGREPAAGVVFWNRLDNVWTNILHGNISPQNLGSLTQPYQNPTNFFSDRLTLSGNVSLPPGEVLYYTSTAAPQYLEGFTYDHFDGHTWTSLLSTGTQDFPANALLPADAAGNLYIRATTHVTIVQPANGPKYYIFGPAQPVAFSVPTSVEINGVTGSWMQQGPLAKGERYEVVSNISSATSQDLSTVPLPQGNPDPWMKDRNYGVIEANYLQVPQLPGSIRRLAQQWTAGAMNTYDVARMLAAHLNDPAHFSYSVNNPPIPGNEDAVSWLLQTHRGYCTHYATAMTIMARLLGIPARVANGFSYGHFDAQRKVWVVDGTDAHSWVQIYFPGYGWINFDPTPGFSLTMSTSPGKTQQSQTTTSNKHPVVQKPTPTGTDGKHSRHGSTGASGTPAVTRDTTVAQKLVFAFSIVILLCSLLFLLAALLYAYWRRNLYRRAYFASRIYWGMCRVARLAGMPPRGWQTPYEYSRMLARQIPAVAAPLRRLTQLFVRERWAAPHEVPYAPEEDDLERLWSHLQRAFWHLLLLRIRALQRPFRRA